MKRLLRFAVISIIILFAVASLLGALLPGTVLVSRAVNIDAYRDSVRPHLQDISQWAAWMEGMQDSSVKIYSPTQAQLGRTAVKITGMTDSTISSSWTATNGSLQTSRMRVIGDSSRRITVVQWQFEQKLRWYPWEKLGSIMNDKILGTMMEKNLNRLKGLVEKTPVN
jgi:thiamine kinase-like enzyme